MKFEKLFSNMRIDSLALKNRIIFPPISTNLASITGEVTDEFIAHYSRRAKGGAALITVENACIDFPLTMMGATQPRFDNERFVPGLSRLVEEIHKYGSLAFVELTHPGLFGKELPAIAPSEVDLRLDGIKPHPMSREEIEKVALKFAKAAFIAKKAGFDGVEIEAAHGLLVNQFLSPVSNKRTDEYGGTLENRTRFAKLLIDKIKEFCGRDYPVMARVGVVDYVNGGIKPEYDGVEIVRKFEELGYAAVHADIGFGDKEKRLEPMAYKQAWRSNLAKLLKDGGIKIPVIAVGMIREPEIAESLLKNGVADLVALGRTLIADPDWPLKALYGKEKTIRKCIGCSECIRSRHAMGTAIRCGVNPVVGKSSGYEKITPSSISKHIVIIGAGPAGLEAARVAALKGHRVTIFEQEKEIGGAVRLGSVPPGKEKMQWLINYYSEVLKELEVDVRTTTTADIETVIRENPDEIVLAMGAEPFIPAIEGIDGPNVVLYSNVLDEKVALQKGERVVIGGGGLVGCETALYLATKGCEVTIVEMLPEVAKDMEPISRNYLLRELKEHNIKILTSSRIIKISESSLNIKKTDGMEIELDLDIFVAAFGEKPRKFEKVDAPVPIHIIGDMTRVGKIVEAIRDGYAIGFNL